MGLIFSLTSLINVNRSFTITKKSESQKCGWEYIHTQKLKLVEKSDKGNLLSKPSLSRVFTRTCIFQAVWTNTDRRTETARIRGQLSHSVNTEINRTNKDKQHLAKKHILQLNCGFLSIYRESEETKFHALHISQKYEKNPVRLYRFLLHFPNPPEVMGVIGAEESLGYI